MNKAGRHYEVYFNNLSSKNDHVVKSTADTSSASIVRGCLNTCVGDLVEIVHCQFELPNGITFSVTKPLQSTYSFYTFSSVVFHFPFLLWY